MWMVAVVFKFIEADVVETVVINITNRHLLCFSTRTRGQRLLGLIIELCLWRVVAVHGKFSSGSSTTTTTMDKVSFRCRTAGEATKWKGKHRSGPHPILIKLHRGADGVHIVQVKMKRGNCIPYLVSFNFPGGETKAKLHYIVKRDIERKQHQKSICSLHRIPSEMKY